MKQIYTCIFLVGLTGFLNAQTFAPVGAEWTMGYTVPMSPDEHGYRTLTVTGDTVKNGIPCRVIEGDLGPHSANLFGDNYVYEEDGKVFAYYDQINQFQKIFDFDAGVGEFWDLIIHETATNAVFNTFRITIDSTFIEVLDGDSTRSYMYSLEVMPNEGTQCPDFYDNLIGLYDLKANEKLGSGHYLFPVPTTWCVADIYEMEWGGHLRCYSDSSLSYENLSSDIPGCTYQNISVEDIEVNQPGLIWDTEHNMILVNNYDYPNNIVESSFKVYDVNGKLTLEQRNQQTLNVSGLTTGVYIITFKYSEGMERLKICID